MILSMEQAGVFIANFAFVRCIMKSIRLGILGYVWACFVVRSVAFVGTFGSVNVSAERDF